MKISIDDIGELIDTLQTLHAEMNATEHYTLETRCNTYGLHGPFISFGSKGYLPLYLDELLNQLQEEVEENE